MTWVSIGSGGTSVNTNNNQTGSTHTITGNPITVGRVGVLIISVENNQTTDGDELAVSGMTDNIGGNLWRKAAEFTNGQGAAQGGATCSIWFCQARTTLLTGSTISWNYSNSASRDESCSTLWVFSLGDPTVAVQATNTLANDAADPGALNAVTPNAAFLRVRGIASELNSVTQLTPTATWSAFDVTRSANVATAMSVRGEWLISTGTGASSDPTIASADHASVYVALREDPVGVFAATGVGDASLGGNALKNAVVAFAATSLPDFVGEGPMLGEATAVIVCSSSRTRFRGETAGVVRSVRETITSSRSRAHVSVTKA